MSLPHVPPVITAIQKSLSAQTTEFHGLSPDARVARIALSPSMSQVRARLPRIVFAMTAHSAWVTPMNPWHVVLPLIAYVRLAVLALWEAPTKLVLAQQHPIEHALNAQFA